MPSLIRRVAVFAACLLSLAHSSPVDYSQDEYSELEERQQTTPENCATGIHMVRLTFPRGAQYPYPPSTADAPRSS